MIEIKTFAKPKKTGGSSGSSSSTKYISGVISEAEHAARADKAKRAEVADQANYAGTAASAQNAAYASEAGNLHEDAEILQQYLSLKDTVDPQVVNGMVIFAKGLMVNLLAQLKGGASFGSDGSYSFDKDGNLVIESARSRDFDEMLQNGFALKRNPTSGKYTLSISDLIVWGRMVINTLEIRKKYAIGGNVYLSGASSKIQHVEKVYSEDGETVVGYKCYILKDDGTMATQNNWVVGDQALCQTFDIEEGVYQNVSNQYYWRLVTQVSEENVAITEKYTDKDGNEQIRELYEGQKFAWVVLSKDDCDTNSGIPASGDTIVLDGHRLTENEDIDYTERTNVLMLEATGSGSPRIIALTGVVDYKHTTDNEVFILSPRKVIFTTEHFEIRTASGAPITFVHFMGPWMKGTEYHYYDQVSHANALWTCIVEKGKSTTDEPTDGSTYWRKEMSGGKGEKGDDAVSYTLEASPGYIRLSSDGSIDYTNGYIDKGDEYGSDKYLVVRGYKVAKGVRDNRFSTEENPVTLRLTINDGSAYSEYTPTDGDSVSIDFEPKYDSYYSMLQEISRSGLNSVRVDLCEGVEYDANKILATLDIPITQSGKDGEKGDDGTSYNINFVTHKDDTHNDTLLYVYVVRSVGKESTNTLISNIPEISETAGLEVRVYCDGVYNENLTNHVKFSGYIQRSAWKTVKNFEVRLYLNDKLVSSNSYSFGEQGTDGKDAISILVEDAPLVFDTDDNGTVSSSVTKVAKVKVIKGNDNVTNDCSGVSSRDDMCANCRCGVVQKDKYIEVSISGSNIIKNDVIVDGVNQGQVSTTSGYAVAQLTYDGVVYFAQVPFSVNVAKFTGAVAFDNKSYKIQFDELSKNAATKDELKNATSTFEQTAREISLSVSEKSIGRRNLLVDSAFLREDNNRVLSDGARIEMNSGYQGTNCIRVIDKTKKGDLHYIGVYWDGSQGGRSIKIKKGKKYTLSCYYKTPMSLAMLSIEAIYTDKQENTTRLGQATYLSPNSFKVKKVNEWELFTTVIDTTDAESDYIAFNFWEACKFTAGTIKAWICRPMVEEGDTYNGWTLSQDDYDIIGANLIDNSRTLDVGGNVFTVIGEKTLVGDVYELKASGSDDFNQFYRIKGDTFKLDTDYTISFEVRGNAKYIQVNAFYPANNTKYTCYIEQQNNVMSETAGDGTTVGYVTLGEFEVLPKQQKVWAHFRFKDRLPEELYFQFTKNAEQTDVTSWNVTITKPKIEEGAVVTEYTERKSDLVDKASLKAAGIEVTANKVKLYGNQIEVKPTKEGNAVYALFGDDGFINTNILNVQHVYAKNASGTVYGHFGYLGATGGTDSDGYQYPLWVGASTCGSAPFSVRSDGYIYATKGKIGPLNIDEKGLFYYPLDINAKLRKATDLRLGGLWVSENLNDCNSELMVGNRCWAFDPLNESKQLQFTSTTLFSYPVIRPSVMIAKRWTNLGNGDSRTDPASPALMVESEGVGITSNGLNYLGGIAMGCTRTSVITNDTLTAMNLNRISFVVMTNGSEYTFPMPKTPVIGQILIVVQGNAKINFDPQGKTIYCGGKIKTTSDKFYSSTVGQFNIFIYDGYYWQLQWINQKL